MMRTATSPSSLGLKPTVTRAFSQFPFDLRFGRNQECSVLRRLADNRSIHNNAAWRKFGNRTGNELVIRLRRRRRILSRREYSSEQTHYYVSKGHTFRLVNSDEQCLNMRIKFHSFRRYKTKIG